MSIENQPGHVGQKSSRPKLDKIALVDIRLGRNQPTPPNLVENYPDRQSSWSKSAKNRPDQRRLKIVSAVVIGQNLSRLKSTENQPSQSQLS